MKHLDVSQNKKIDKYPTPFWGNIKYVKCWTILAHRGSLRIRCIIVAQNGLWLVRVGHSKYALGHSGS